MAKFDLVISGGRVLDAASGLDAVRDVGISGGRIAEVSEELDPGDADDIIDASGRWVMPGMIDPHVHVSWAFAGITDPTVGLRMVVEAGATTAIDLGGDISTLIDGIGRRGSGLNVGGLGMLRPGYTLPQDDPPMPVIRDVLSSALNAGSLGLKMWGGYYPFTPEVTANIIAACNEERAYVAFHVGTKETGSRLDGLREVPGLLGADGRVHIAHVNAYCRGSILPPGEEVWESLEIIDGLRDRVVSEVHMATPNFTLGSCDPEGNAMADVVKNCLRLRGYPPTADGIRSAIRDGYGSAVVQSGGRMQLVAGPGGVEVFDAAETNVALSFPVNRADTAFQLTAAKRDDASFIIDAVGSDAGVFPRNVNIEKTMAMVRFGALEPLDMAAKLSYNPALMLGFARKGRISEDADADFTIVDPVQGRAVMSLAGGKVIMVDGRAVGVGGTLLITGQGEATVRNSGVQYEVVDVSQALMYQDT